MSEQNSEPIYISSDELKRKTILGRERNPDQQKASSWKQMITFEGRSSRTRFGKELLGFLSAMVSAVLLYFGITRFHTGFAQSLRDNSWVIYFCGLSSTYLSLLAQISRRLHDVGKSAWWMLVPLYNIYLLSRPSVGPNNYGEIPTL